MDVKTWFPTLIWDDVISSPKLSNTRLLNYALELSEGDSEQKSNMGGWQSNASVIFQDAFQPLVNELGLRVQEIANQINVSPEWEIYLDSGWVNINGKGDYNNPHVHAQSFLSCVYYVSVPEDSETVIEFEDPRDQRKFCEPKRMYWAPVSYTDYSVEYTPMNGRVIFFPSYLRHLVTPNKSDTKRVSIALNYGIRKR